MGAHLAQYNKIISIWKSLSECFYVTQRSVFCYVTPRSCHPYHKDFFSFLTCSVFHSMSESWRSPCDKDESSLVCHNTDFCYTFTYSCGIVYTWKCCPKLCGFTCFEDLRLRRLNYVSIAHHWFLHRTVGTVREIHYHPVPNYYWCEVLESVFLSFKNLVLGNKIYRHFFLQRKIHKKERIFCPISIIC